MVAESIHRASDDDTARGLVEYALEQTDRVRNGDTTTPPFFQPDSFSGYVLGPLIHRGGQGYVFRATQRSTGRTVALKVLRDGLFASDADRERLAREARILVELDHPNIVGISDSGIAAGHNYFVMDFVDGVALDEFVRSLNLELRSTLELFAKVCEAVQAAHLKGVIHRDLKPSNIRVTTDGTPRVLDFGLAKNLEHNGNGESGIAASITETGQFVGSLPWASPEQARGDWGRVDMRTDVYSLGVVLFQLLTGRFPYVVMGPLPEVLASITRSEPVRPLSLSSKIDSDVETILLRCLDKDPDRRYQTAGELARDVRRYLAGEPIDAKRDSTLYVLRKKIRRYRVGVGVACLILVVLAGATVVSTVFLRRARFAETTSLRHAADARANFQLVNKTVKAVLGELSSQFAQTVGGDAGTRPVLELAYANLVPLASERSDDPEAQAGQGQALFLLGDIALGLGKREEGRAHLTEAEKIRRELLESHPDDLETWAELSINLVRLGDSFGDDGDTSQQLSYYVEAWHIDEELVRRAPENGHFADNLGWSYERLSHSAEASHSLPSPDELLASAASVFEELILSEPQNPQRWFALGHMRRLQGQRDAGRGNFAIARNRLEQSVRCAETAVSLKEDNRVYVHQLAMACRAFASLLSQIGEIEEAECLAREADAAILQSFGDEQTDSWGHGMTWEVLGIKADLAQRRNDWASEREYSARRLDYMERVFLPQTGYSLKTLEEKFENLRDVAQRRYEHGEGDSVRPLMEEAIRIGEELTSPEDAPVSRLLEFSMLLRQAVPPDLQDAPKAVLLAERAVALTGGKAIEPLKELMLALVADGQVERAREVQRQALDFLPIGDSPARTAVQDAFHHKE